MDEDILLFAGSASGQLTERIAAHLGVGVAAGEVLRYPEGNLFVRVLQNVRGRAAYIVQSVALDSNNAFMELLFWIDALKRASAASVTAVIPYFSYAKGDKKDEPRVSIRGRVCADALEAAGVDRVVTVDLHAPQVQGFFRVPVDDLYAMPALCGALRALRLSDPLIVAPDIGFAKKARAFARALDAPLAIADKERTGLDGGVVIHDIIGDIAGRSAIIVDDFTISGSTLAAVADGLVQRGARSVCAALSHGLFGGAFMRMLDRSPIQRLIVTDSVRLPREPSPKVQIVSLAPLLAEAIRRIHERRSISVLFQNTLQEELQS